MYYRFNLFIFITLNPGLNLLSYLSFSWHALDLGLFYSI